MRLLAASAISVLLVTAGAAYADCVTEFTEANKTKLEAGPYRLIMRNQTTNEVGGKKYAGKPTSQTYEFAPPDAVHLNDKSPLGDTEAIYMGKTGWTKEKGDWKSVPAAEMSTLIERGLYGTYFNAPKPNSLVCHGVSVNSGLRVRSYSYAIPVEDIVPRELAITAYFSADSGLPLAAVVETMVVKTFHRTEMAVEFDRAIKIQRPN
ncbi:hypothetical protein [Ottowia thiooxydans]|uniref:hypothetical protein n=1 Tax=Ottowia thiooxydans TaxID=219182 RepID=UPI00040E41D3|nr:hypothetical protein [Ottowia thiooxydans]